MKQLFRNIMLFGIATAMFTACGDEPEVTKKDTSKPVAIENGAIKAAFSVSVSEQVYFSQGNLQYQASTNTWRFAENQWDIIGEANENISENYDGWIDLFGWGTSGYNDKYPYMTSEYYGDYGDGENDIAGTNYDWGRYNKISNGGNQAGMWRTLTIGEWCFLRNRVAVDEYGNGTYLYQLACVNNVNGLILFPDDWDVNLPVNAKYGSEYFSHEYSLDEWAILQSYGAVFFPAAGYRKGTVDYDVNYEGLYWSSSDDYFSFENKHVDRGYEHTIPALYFGSSVRLVQDVK